jgi:hypothetical protein
LQVIWFWFIHLCFRNQNAYSPNHMEHL